MLRTLKLHSHTSPTSHTQQPDGAVLLPAKSFLTALHTSRVSDRNGLCFCPPKAYLRQPAGTTNHGCRHHLNARRPENPIALTAGCCKMLKLGLRHTHTHTPMHTRSTRVVHQPLKQAVHNVMITQVQGHSSRTCVTPLTYSCVIGGAVLHGKQPSLPNTTHMQNHVPKHTQLHSPESLAI